MTTGIQILNSERTSAMVERITRESKIKITVDREKRKEASEIKTGIPFFDHMLETISWRACMNIDVSVERSTNLSHVTCEDVGITLGTAIFCMVEKSIEYGINCSADATVALDEALSMVVLSIEGRPRLYITEALEFEHVENMSFYDLKAFLEGLSLGMKATIHVDILKGEDPHHVWESVFRSFGECLRIAFAENKWRKGMTVGIKGTFE